MRTRTHIWYALHVLPILLALCLLTNSCKKDLHGKYEMPEKLNNNSEAVKEFLTIPKNATENLKEILADISRKETDKSFLGNFIQNNEVPNWDQAISSLPLLYSGNPTSTENIVNSQASQTKPNAPGVYFIPLENKVSHAVSSFIYCAKTGDSTYTYQVFNKNKILNTKPTNRRILNNGIYELSVFAAFENKMHNQKMIQNPYPYGFKFHDAKISFNFSNKSKSVSTNSINSTERIKVKSNSEGCEEIRSGYLNLGFIILPIVYSYNHCTDQYTILSINYGSIDNSGGSASGSSNTGSGGDTSGNSGGGDAGGSGNGTGDYGGFFGGYGGSNGGGSSDPGYTSGGGGSGGWSTGSPYDPFVGISTDPGFQELSSDIYVSGIVKSLQNELGLDILETNYLNANQDAANDIFNELQDEDDEDGSAYAAKVAAKVSIDQEMYGMGNGPFDNTYKVIIVDPNPFFKPFIEFTSNFAGQLMKWGYTLKSLYAAEKNNDPNRNPIVLGFRAIKPILQQDLDIIAAVPGPIGGIADFTNSAIYLFSGDTREASLRFEASLQNTLLATGKWSSPNIRLALKEGTYMIQLDQEVRFFRNQKAARKKLNLSPNDGNIAHHLLPFILGDHIVVQRAAQDGFHINDLANLKKIEKSLHTGSHANYTQRVRQRLDGINSAYGNNISPHDAVREINILITDIVTQIESHPGININDIVF